MIKWKCYRVLFRSLQSSILFPTIKKQTMLSILYNIITEKTEMFDNHHPKSDKKVVAPLPPENNNLHYFLCSKKNSWIF